MFVLKCQDKCKAGLGPTAEMTLTLLQPVRSLSPPRTVSLCPWSRPGPGHPHPAPARLGDVCTLIPCLLVWHSDGLASPLSHFVPESEPQLLHPGTLLVSFCTPGNQALWPSPKTSSCDPQSPTALGKQFTTAGSMSTPHLGPLRAMACMSPLRPWPLAHLWNSTGSAPAPEVSLPR